jgi:hypothetical protein
MTICKKELLARSFLVIVATVLLCMSFAISTRLAPGGVNKLITFNHEIRRVLLRAERENLRTGVSVEKMPVIIHPTQDFGEASSFSESALTYRSASLFAESLIHTETLSFRLSPILNL